MSYTKKLSFIIPAYNCAAFMDETFGSVLSQLPSDCELIAVDDGKGKLKHNFSQPSLTGLFTVALLVLRCEKGSAIYKQWHFVFSYISGFFGLLILRRASLVTEIPDTVDSIGCFILIMLLGNIKSAAELSVYLRMP